LDWGNHHRYSLALSSQRHISILKVENKDVSRCWSSCIVESSFDGASSLISVNSKELFNGCGGFSSIDSSSDKIGFSESRGASNFEVNLSDGVQSSGP
jgi:hypothetical protein